MKTGTIARSLGIDIKTITNWLNRDEFRDFFSSSAKLETGKAHREFDFNDQILLNTIRHLRHEQGEKDWEKITAQIQSGFRQTEMPDSYHTTENTTSMKVYTQMIEIKNQLDLIVVERDQLRTELEKERGRSQKELTEQRARSEIEFEKERIRLRSELKEERTRLQGELKAEREEIIDLNRQIARLEVRMEILQENDDED